MGLSRALGALTGIGGSLAFPFFHSRLGLGWTGLVGLGSQAACLTLPVASLALPGSPFHWLGAGNQTTAINGTASSAPPQGDQPHSLISILVFVTGIVLSRFGLK